MVAETATIQSDIPIIALDYNQKAEIRSIEEVFPEYTNSASKVINSSIINLLNNWFSNKKEKDIKTASISDFSGEMMFKPYYVKKQQVNINSNSYEFVSEFIYIIKLEDDMYIAENEFFEIFGYGETVEQAEQELFLCIEDLWNVYVEELDDNLDESALILKDKLLKNVRKMK